MLGRGSYRRFGNNGEIVEVVPVTMPPITLSEMIIELEACEAAARVAEALVIAAFGRELAIPARAVQPTA